MIDIEPSDEELAAEENPAIDQELAHIDDDIQRTRGTAHTEMMFTLCKTPLVTKEQEHALTKRVAEGDHDARTKMILANQRLVVWMAMGYASCIDNKIDIGDLISEGNIGLIHALEKFDNKRGFRFITYATYWVRSSMLDCLKTQLNHIRIPKSALVNVRRLHTAMQQHYATSGTYPSDVALSQKLAMPRHEITFLKGLTRTVKSLSSPLSTQENGMTHETHLADTRTAPAASHLHTTDIRTTFATILTEEKRCDQTDREIFALQREGLTPKEIAARIGRSRKFVQDHLTRIHRVLRKHPTLQGLMEHTKDKSHSTKQTLRRR